MRVGHDTKRTPGTTSGLLRRPLVALVALATVGVLAAGCGSSSSGSGGSGSGGGLYGGSSVPTTAPSAVATVSATSTSLGTILVDGSGRTLYLFEKDQSDQSACAGACAAAWPPLRATGKPAVGTSLSASKIGTTARSDGKPQVTYNGHPLYLYAADQKPGDTNGQGLNIFGGGWFALSAAGNMVSGTGSNPSGRISY